MKQPSFKLSNKTIAILGSATLFGFSLLSFVMMTILAPNESFIQLITEGKSLIYQILTGLLFGLAAFMIIQFFLKREFFPELFDNVLNFAKQLNWYQIIFISVAAGIGEELLFRLAIQYFLGIWPTAILFVLIHGYYNLNKPLVFLYGIVMTIISGGFGYLYINYGIVAPIIAHFLIDLLILSFLKTYHSIETQ